MRNIRVNCRFYVFFSIIFVSILLSVYSFFLRQYRESNEGGKGEDSIGENLDTILHFDEQEKYQQYETIILDEMTYYATNDTVSEDWIEERISIATGIGWDPYAQVKNEDPYNYTDVGVYQLKDINSELAVAVKYDASMSYYVAYNYSYNPISFAAILSDVGLEKNLKAEIIRLYFYELSSEIPLTIIEQNNGRSFLDGIICSLFWSCYNDILMSNSKDNKIMIEIEFRLDSLGDPECNLSIFDNGIVRLLINGFLLQGNGEQKEIESFVDKLIKNT